MAPLLGAVLPLAGKLLSLGRGLPWLKIGLPVGAAAAVFIFCVLPLRAELAEEQRKLHRKTVELADVQSRLVAEIDATNEANRRVLQAAIENSALASQLAEERARRAQRIRFSQQQAIEESRNANTDWSTAPIPDADARRVCLNTGRIRGIHSPDCGSGADDDGEPGR